MLKYFKTFKTKYYPMNYYPIWQESDMLLLLKTSAKSMADVITRLLDQLRCNQFKARPYSKVQKLGSQCPSNSTPQLY